MSAYIQNRRATFDFEILKTYEAGLVLHGFETKAIRAGKGSLKGSHVVVRGGEALLIGASINPYQPANTPKNYNPERNRTLLLSKKEIAEIDQKTNTERLTAIPIKLYNSGRKIKLEIAVARGKKKTDKRENIKERETKRDIERTLKNFTQP